MFVKTFHPTAQRFFPWLLAAFLLAAYAHAGSAQTTTGVVTRHASTNAASVAQGAPDDPAVRAVWLERTDPDAKAILRYWFEEWDDDLKRGGRGRYNEKWFPHGPAGAAGSAAVDREIRKRFMASFERAAADELGWNIAENPYENLAYILLIDQFSRNMFRGQDRAYAHDALAFEAARINVEKGFHRYYFTGYQKLFVVYPFMHDETLDSQTRSIAYLKTINESPDHRYAFLNAFEKGIEHYQMVFMFGRFPHRNVRLGRQNTALEKHYLEKKGTQGFVDGSKW